MVCINSQTPRPGGNLAAAGKQTDRPRARAAETVYEGCVILPSTGSVGYGDTGYSDSWLE